MRNFAARKKPLIAFLKLVKMSKIELMKRTTLTLIAVFMSTMMWAQSLSGSGTDDDPYLISSDDDWTTFANVDNADTYWKIGKCVRLDANITVSAMVGTSSYYYKGTFDGNWHTITLNITSSAENAAPFSYIQGANMKNLKIEGSVTTSSKYAGSLIGSAKGHNTITSCTSTATINISTNGDASTGGLAGRVLENGGVLSFNNCSFEGAIIGVNAQKCAGFVGWVAGTVGYTNCLMAGTISISQNTSTFNRQANNASVSADNAYYITSYNGLSGNTNPGPDGTLAPTSEPTTVIGKKYTKDATDYYVPGAALVTGLEATTYSYTGNDIIITPHVTYYGWTLTENTDYEISYEKQNGETWESALVIKDGGDYRIIISGKDNYVGSYTSPTIHVVSYTSWASVKAILADASNGDRVITLSGDIFPENPSGEDVALVVNGNVVLNLDGHIIDRKLYTENADPVVKGQVIRVNSGANLTINGGSNRNAIKGGYNYADGTDNDAGGIYNKGNLVLNNVNINHNGCMKGDQGATSNTARGGGIYSGSGSSLVINGGSIESNNARGGGGGVYSEGANPFTMTGTDVKYNQSESKGGGIRVKTTGTNVAYLTDCSIWLNLVTDNTADGGGVYMEGGELHMTNCEIMGNQSRYRGCGFFSIRGTTVATNCNISYNGSYSVEDNNLGGGICLYDNKGTDHSKFIMDGGTVEANNSNNHGGGIYVFDCAEFLVKGDVQIRDNYKASVATGASDNNAYLAGTSFIEVVGPLAEDAYIVITPRDDGGTCVKFAEGVPTEGALSHFALDNDEYRLIPVDGHIEYYKLYPWDDPNTWDGTIATYLNGVPTASNSVTINRAIKIPSDCVALANTINLGDYGEIIIADGGQLIHNNAVTATLQKNISAYTVLANQGESKTNGWYTIASPVTDDLDKECVAIGEYDLYLYNEPTHYWWNAKDGSGHGFNTLSNGHGYLYANEKNVTLNFTGPMQATSANVSVPLSYTEAADNLKGYNLVGNPFTCNLTSSDAILVGEPLTTYMYVANGNEMVTATLSERPIQPGEGFFVQASGAGQNLVFNHEVSEPNKTAFIRIEAGDNSFMDRAYVQFGQGNTLHKMTINDDVPHLSIQQGRDDYASTTIKANHGTIPVSFKAATNGSYTITVSHEGMEMDYLHLIDNLTGADTDLLSEPSYTFTASNHDYASRFRLVYSSGTTAEESDNENFAFINDGQIILSGVIGDATVQLIDMNGRVVYCRDAVHTISTSGMTSGVYVLRLIQDDIVKTQKIVIG